MFEDFVNQTFNKLLDADFSNKKEGNALREYFTLEEMLSFDEIFGVVVK